MKNLFILLLTCLTLCTCAQINNDKVTRKKYPSWFLHPQNSIMGMSPKYFYQKTSLDNATQAALERFSKLKYTIVKGSQTYIQNYEGISLVEDSLYINVFEDNNFDTTFLNSYSICDTFSTDAFIALCWQKNNTKELLDTNRVYCSNEVKWVQQVPAEENYRYALGSCDALASEWKSWQRAENYAILNIARQVSMDKFVEELFHQGTRMSKTIENINIDLQNLKIVERWKNEKNNIYFVLVKIRK